MYNVYTKPKSVVRGERSRYTKLMPIILALFISFIVLGAAAEHREIRLASGRQAVAEIHATKENSTWIVYLPGSDDALFNPGNSFWLTDFRARRPRNLMILNKSGISFTGTDLAAFDTGALKPNRINDALEMMSAFLPANAEVMLVGDSEGAYVAPEIALRDSRVKSMLLMSGGTRGWIDEEIMMAPAAKREDVRRLLESEVMNSADLSKRFRGWTYAQLASYQNSGTYDALMQTQIPVLALHGEQDRMIWLAGALEDWEKILARGPGGKTSIVLPGQGHGVNGPAACEEILKFAK